MKGLLGWGLQHFCCRLGIEKFPVDDEFDKNLVLIWGYWVKKGGDMGIGDPLPPKKNIFFGKIKKSPQKIQNGLVKSLGPSILASIE